MGTIQVGDPGAPAPEPEHNLSQNWKKENMGMATAVMMAMATALWIVIAFVVKPNAIGYVGIVGIFSSVQWMPYLMALIYYNGMYKKLAYAPLTAEVPAWVKRAMVAHNNALENFMLFAIAVFFFIAVDPAKELASINFWCLFYFACRCYYFVFTIAPPIFMMKTAMWMMGWVATTVIFAKGLARMKTNDFTM